MTDYEDAINLQGSWGYSPTTPLVDQQTKDIKESQSVVYRMVEEAVPSNCTSRDNQA